MPVRLTIRPPRVNNPRIVEFDDARVTIGRSSSCDIRLPFRVVSGHHLTIFQTPNSLQVRDEHSTNGTLLDGEPLAGGAERQLAWGATLKIVDLSIEVEMIPDLSAGTSLEHTGTMARQMLGEALLAATSNKDEPESAYFEVLDGPSLGHRLEVPDDLDRGLIGDTPDALIGLSGLAVPLEIYRDGDGFGLRVGSQTAPDAPVLLNDEPLLEGRRLTSGDTIICKTTMLRFVDPLEAYLDELDGVVASTKQPSSSSSHAPTEEAASLASRQKAKTTIEAGDPPEETGPMADAKATRTEGKTKNPDSSKRSLSVIEVGVIAVSLVVIAGVLYLLLSIFGLL